MFRNAPPRRLATLLFTDMVGSTEIAVELGDRRWRVIQARHHAVVRRELKRFGGHEIDTAGDGFFARFDAPDAGVRCACAIVEAVRVIGVEIKAGLHFGEAELSGEKLGGIAVTTGARVGAVAGAGEVLVTSTIVDLVAGSGLEFADHGTRDLKGIPVKLHLFAVTAVDGKPLPPPLDPAEAAAKRNLKTVLPQRSPRKRLAILGLASVVVAATVIGVLTAGRRSRAAAPSPPALLRIDPSTNAIVQRVGVRPDAENTVVGAVDGSLWQVESRGKGQVRTRNDLIRRRIKDGSQVFAVPKSNLSFEPTFGFGSAWKLAPPPPPPNVGIAAPLSGQIKNHRMLVTRYDEASGRTKTFSVPGLPMTRVWSNAYRAFVAGPSGVWYLNGDNTRLSVIDPTTNQVRSYPTGRWGAYGPDEVLPTKDAVWLCDSWDKEIKRFAVA
ncbi:MAG: adenylate/guanylate cyclase domain-containing protein, partial [Actinomycetota bacterium]|nr:adenylate/guanylate cyclase domain-containing protein [Actinomycetota bacterium]